MKSDKVKMTRNVSKMTGRRTLIYFVLLIIAVLVCAFSLRLGSADMSWKDFISALLNKKGYDTFSFIIYGVRLPRIAAGAVAGIGLSLAGVLLQTVTGNDLAGPNIIGVNAGAGFVMIAMLYFAPRLYSLTPIAAFLGAFITTIIIVIIGMRSGGNRNSVILAGIAVTTMLSAGISFISLLDTDVLASYNYFSVGSLESVQLKELSVPCLTAIICTLITVAISSKIDIIFLGDAVASSLGVRVKTVRFLCMIFASAAASSVVSFAGLLGFVGLVVPHIARKIVGQRTLGLTISSALLGVIIVVAADTAGRTIFKPTEVPVGIMMSVIGAPFFLYLLLIKRGRR